MRRVMLVAVTALVCLYIAFVTALVLKAYDLRDSDWNLPAIAPHCVRHGTPVFHCRK